MYGFFEKFQAGGRVVRPKTKGHGVMYIYDHAATLLLLLSVSKGFFVLLSH